MRRTLMMIFGFTAGAHSSRAIEGDRDATIVFAASLGVAALMLAWRVASDVSEARREGA